MAMGAAALLCAAAPALGEGLPAATPEVLRYNRFWYVFHFAAAAWGAAGLALVVFSGWGAALRDRVERRFRRPVARLAAYYIALAALLGVWGVPPSLAAYLHERAYGFAVHSPWRWLADEGLAWLTGTAAMLPVMWVATWAVRRWPRRWWLALWAALVPLALLFTVIYPLAVAPLYSRFRPLPPGPVRSDLLALAARAGIPETGIFVVDISRRTRKLNAYVTGLGPSRRIVLWDTTLAALPLDQVRAITAHEIGHYVLGHVWWSFAASMGAALAILWLLSRLLPYAIARLPARAGVRGITDLAAIPPALLAVAALLFLQEPLAARVSRAQERQADRFAVRMVGDGAALADGFRQFVERDWANPDPPPFIVFWMGSHPPLRERVENARAGAR